MHESANVRAVRHIYRSFELGQIESILTSLSTDIAWRFPAMKGVPFAGTWSGRDGVKEFFALLNRARELLDFKAERFIAQGDTVIALGRFILRANATGWDAASDWAHVWDMKDGNVARFTAYIDTGAVALAHLGRQR